MAWVVFDRAVRLAERFALEGPVERWKQIGTRSTGRSVRRVSTPSVARSRSTTGQGLDASVLNIPLVGFLPGGDERVADTIGVSRELGRDGFVSRYRRSRDRRRLSGDEGQFLACSFWLVSALAVNGQVDEAMRAVRATDRSEQRSRPAGRGVRREAAASGRQLPSSLQPPHADRSGGSDCQGGLQAAA